MAVHAWSLIEVDRDTKSTLRTRTLSTNGVFLIQHVPNVSLDDGQPITESIDVQFSDYGGDTAREISQEVNTYLEQANRYGGTRYGPRVYLVFSASDEATSWRSEITAGMITWDMDALRAYSSATMRGTIVLERLNYWERTTELTLVSAAAMTNNGTSKAALIDPTGTMPTPVRVEIVNTNGSTNLYEAHIGLNTDCNPGTITTGAQTILAAATDSWSDDAGALSNTESKSFSDAELGYQHGEAFHAVASVSARTGGFYMWGEVRTGGRTDTETQRVHVDAVGLYDLGVVHLPPGGDSEAATDVDLFLQFENDEDNDAGSYTLAYVQLLPASGYRKMSRSGSAVADAAKWVDDGIHNLGYTVEGSTKNYNISVTGSPLMAQPTKASELKVIAIESGPTVDTAQSWTISAYCRPRRRTL